MVNYWNQLVFASPWVFGLLAAPVAFVLWQLLRRKQLYPTLRLPILQGVAAHSQPIRGLIKQYLYVLRVLVAIFLIIALARPQIAFSEQEVSTDGIDIVMAIDVSGSMNALDFQPDRLGAAKEKAQNFMDGRPNDRLGLVVFAGESFTQCPITTDHDVLKKLLKEVKHGQIEDGTAIGMGLATAVNRLKDSETKSKVVILLTDGVNNSGFIEPLTAVEAALEYGIRVYTIGVGTKGTAKQPLQTAFGTVYRDVEVEIDEELLREIAQKTEGKYFRATSNQALEAIYTEINDLETSRLQVSVLTRKTEEFPIFLLIGAALFLLEMLLRYGVVRSVP